MVVSGPLSVGIVITPMIALAQIMLVLADVPPVPLKQLSDLSRAKVLAALAGLIILGFGMVLLTWLGARVTQRYRRGTSYFRPTARPGELDWAKKSLAPGETDTDNKNPPPGS